MLLYQAKNALKLLLRRPWRFLNRMPVKAKLYRARLAAMMSPGRKTQPPEVLYPPLGVKQTTAEWFADKGRMSGAAFHRVDAACTVRNTLPKTVHATVRRQLLMDQDYPFPETFVATLPNARVWRDGFVITPDNQLLSDVSVDFHAENGRSSIYLNWALQPITEIDGTVAVLATHGAELYYHWLFQLLPRLELIRRANIPLERIDFFLVNGVKAKFQRESLEILGIAPDRILESDRTPHLRARELVVPSNPLGGGCFRPWMCQFLRDTFLRDADNATAPSGRRIYVSRRQAKYRRVLNEPDVIRFLVERGFEDITFEGLTMPQQAALMANVEVVVAPHGGGLSNLVFCSPGTKVIEVFSPELVAGFFWKISSQLGLNYYYLLGRGHPASMEADYEQTWEAYTDIEVDLDRLAKTLDLAGIH